MAHEFCTLFDVNYLTRAIAMYRSLEDVAGDFRLRAYCMDEASPDVLASLDLPRLSVVPLGDLERYDPELLSTKPDRTQVEYCWTATPAVCLHALETEAEIQEITYLDADLMFFADPAPLFDELGDDAVTIVPHRYAPEHRWKEIESGIYNVEWLTFRRDADGLAALRWWHDRCIEWCYYRVEDGKMGDQKYLDDWPARFERVHVLRHPGGGLAPWNVTNHDVRATDGRVVVDGLPLVFFHYHSLRLYRRSPAPRAAALAGLVRDAAPDLAAFWQTNYPAPSEERRLVWNPYLRRVAEAYEEVRRVRPGFSDGLATLPARATAVRLARGAARRAKGSAVAVARATHPGRWSPRRLPLYRGSWRSRTVARQMVEVTDRQLLAPETTPPFRAFRELVHVLVADPELPTPAALLDIGCGVGAYGELLERWAPGRFRYVGADYSDEVLEAARARWPRRSFVRRDVFDANALDGYDVVLASGLVDVLPDPERALRALCAARAPWLVLHRQRIVDDRTRVEVAPGYEGQRTYRASVTRGDLAAVAGEHGRGLSAEVQVDGNVWSFLLRRGAA